MVKTKKTAKGKKERKRGEQKERKLKGRAER